ncbi:quinone oxidoreductase family protein [Fodinicola feengrottensis]|uniref:Medium chain dehydrogenase/reductase family protein n=1 Tax=Fodinicola feengrottensis TaxID=435914 RepID=A0ABN2J560_9ACTN|nr:zinc-binding dehydrogenase [Fodinicola feengrottensis]
MTEIHFRKVVVDRFGGPEVLRTVETTLAAPPPGHVRLKVLAIGVGFTDLMARSGEYLLQRKVPFSPGYELVGEVVDTGSNVDLAPGVRVAVSLPEMGAYAEYVTLPAWLAVPVPTGLDTVVAATIPLDYLTALSVLETHARVGAGDPVLIQGAGGGVGQALSQLGKLKGLRMYGTASAEGSAQRLARTGVRFIDYRRDDFVARMREFEPGGVQAVFDHIGGGNLRKGYRLLKPGGVLVSYAFAGRPGHMVGDTVRGGARVQLMGLLPGKRTGLCMLPKQARSHSDWYRESLGRLLTLADKGDLRPTVGATFGLAEAAKAHRALEDRAVTGKVVLVTG